jgi:hypothetical protein
MTVLSFNSSANTYQVARGSAGSTATAHNAGDSVLHLQASTFVVPFGLNFFANRASVNFLHTVSIPDVRVAASQFFVTNAFGDSEASQQCYTASPDGGLRTLSGGQFSLQVSGTLATQQNATPTLFIEATHAVRDIRASVNQPPVGYNVTIDLLQNGTPYCTLIIPSGSLISNVLDGVQLPALTGSSSLSLNLSLNLIQGFQGSINPGRDLTLTIRL